MARRQDTSGGFDNSDWDRGAPLMARRPGVVRRTSIQTAPVTAALERVPVLASDECRVIV